MGYVCLFPLSIISQTSKQYFLQGLVQDAVTRLHIEGQTTVDLLSPDSVSIITSGFLSNYPDKTGRTVTHLYLPVKQSGKYVIRLQNNNYHTLFHPISITLHQREDKIGVGPLFLRRRLVSESYDIDEIIVNATKIKFYFDEDTLVYNAAQYVTQKGFVLNDIIKKLPGIEINKYGEIFSNGRKVEYLLLNGKDFFNKDRKTLLENLPAFTVKDIIVYQRDADSLAVIEREKKMSGLTMDVRLKKDYQIASMANIDGGGGTDKRYYGKLFGLVFSPFHRMSVYAITNNINRNEQLDAKGNSEKNIDNGDGEKETMLAGIDYNVDDRQGKYELEGDVHLLFNDVTQIQKSKQQNYLTDGDLFGKTSNSIKGRSLTFSSKHKLHLLAKSRFGFILTPSLNYSIKKNRVSSTEALFKSDIDSFYGQTWLEDISPLNNSSLSQLYGTRTTSNNQLAMHKSKVASIGLDKSISVPRTNDVLRLSAGFSYSIDDGEGFSQWDINYHTFGTTQRTDKYEKLISKKTNISFQSDYTFRLTGSKSLIFCYSFKNNKEISDSPIYSLNGLNEHDRLPIGVIPDESLLSAVRDNRNSSDYTQQEKIQQFRTSYIYNKVSYENNCRGEEKLDVTLSLAKEKRNLHIKQGKTDTIALQNRLLPEVSVAYSIEKFNMKEQHGFLFILSYKYKEKLPAILQAVDIYNDAIPTQIRCGNPDLKSSSYHYPVAQFMFKPSPRNDHSIAYEELFSEREVVNSLLYNRETGVYQSRPMNVNGNRLSYFTIKDNFYTNKSLLSKISNYLNIIRNNNVSFMGTNKDELANARQICTYDIGEKLSYAKTTRDNKHRFEAGMFVDYYFSTTHDNGFQPASIYYYGISTSANIEMPHNIRFNIDYTGQKRSGHFNTQINGDEHILNMILTRAFSNDIILQFEGIDLFGQRKNYFRSITAQNRMEIETNNLGRYVMLHFIWRVNSKPKSEERQAQNYTHEHSH